MRGRREARECFFLKNAERKEVDFLFGFIDKHFIDNWEKLQCDNKELLRINPSTQQLVRLLLIKETDKEYSENGFLIEKLSIFCEKDFDDSSITNNNEESANYKKRKSMGFEEILQVKKKMHLDESIEFSNFSPHLDKTEKDKCTQALIDELVENQIKKKEFQTIGKVDEIFAENLKEDFEIKKMKMREAKLHTLGYLEKYLLNKMRSDSNKRNQNDNCVNIRRNESHSFSLRRQPTMKIKCIKCRCTFIRSEDKKEIANSGECSMNESTVGHDTSNTHLKSRGPPHPLEEVPNQSVGQFDVESNDSRIGEFCNFEDGGTDTHDTLFDSGNSFLFNESNDLYFGMDISSSESLDRGDHLQGKNEDYLSEIEREASDLTDEIQPTGEHDENGRERDEEEDEERGEEGEGEENYGLFNEILQISNQDHFVCGECLSANRMKCKLQSCDLSISRKGLCEKHLEIEKKLLGLSMFSKKSLRDRFDYSVKKGKLRENEANILLESGSISRPRCKKRTETEKRCFKGVFSNDLCEGHFGECETEIFRNVFLQTEYHKELK